MTTEVRDANEYGVFSPKWTIQMAAEHAPKENLTYAFGLAVEYVNALSEKKSVMAPQDALDMFGQVILTGKYTPTIFPVYQSETPTPPEDDDPDEDEEESATEKWNRENAITEEEIEAEAAWLDMMKDADDPQEGFKL